MVTAPFGTNLTDPTSAGSSIIRYRLPSDFQWHLLRLLVCLQSNTEIVLFPRGQECVRGRALRSILAVRKVSREKAEKIVDEVFVSCFNDHAPFGRIPHGKKDAGFAYRDYNNRDRYYANL